VGASGRASGECSENAFFDEQGLCADWLIAQRLRRLTAGPNAPRLRSCSVETRGRYVALDLDLKDSRQTGGNRILLAIEEPRAGFVALLVLRAPTWPCGGRTRSAAAQGPGHRDSRTRHFSEPLDASVAVAYVLMQRPPFADDHRPRRQRAGGVRPLRHRQDADEHDQAGPALDLVHEARMRGANGGPDHGQAAHGPPAGCSSRKSAGSGPRMCVSLYKSRSDESSQTSS
jgi:hypothetical protein